MSAFGMNPEEVKREGGKLQQNASTLNDEINNLIKYNDQLQQVWKGSGSQTYFEKWDEKKVSIKKLHEWLEKYANSTVSAANEIIKADSETSSKIG